MSFALHRIDDRLIHGQVLVAWGSRLDPRRMWVVDDGVAANAWEKALFADAAPGIGVSVLTVEEAAGAHAAEASAPGSTFLLVRDLATARRLHEAGVRVPAWNVGGLHYAPGKTKVGQKSGTPFAGFGGNSKEPIKIDANKLEVFDKENRGVYSGDVVAVQGQSTLRCTVMTMPPFAVPSSFVSTIPVTRAASVNSLACCKPFCPVVASITSSVW